MKRIDLVGQTIGPFKVLSLDEKLTTKNNRSHFICICDKCGQKCVVNSSEIKRAQSCGCMKGVGLIKKDAWYINRTSPRENRLLNYARRNSKRRGEECDLRIEDIVIPEYCPLLGIKLEAGSHSKQDTSPSVDRIDSSKGYTRENVWVISQRANRIKNNSTIEELRMIYEGLLQRVK